MAVRNDAMLEKMDEFFNSRLDGYEEHQLNKVKSGIDK